jgi:hypothetical protein
MITCNLMGGLGNQLFQVFTTISYSIKSRKKYVFFKTETLGEGSTTKRNTYWNNLLHKLEPSLINNQIECNLIKEKGFTYENFLPEINKSINKNVCLFGFFQSYKYFDDTFKIICKLINIDEQRKTVLDSYNNTINFNIGNTVSMHFRLGDYKKLQNYHPVMSYEYYLNALSFIKNNDDELINVLFFCEDDDLNEVTKTINKLNLDFPNLIFVRANNSLSDWEQMLLMSCCKHNIIANSSFSWWGAYFNQTKNKIICYPSLWFGISAKHNTKDLCPSTWVKINSPYIIL